MTQVFTSAGNLPLSILDDRPRRYTTTQPFTYRDTMTVLREIEELKTNLNKMVDYLNDMSKDMDDLEDAVRKAIVDITERMDRALRALKEELITLIQQANRFGMTESPVRGDVQSVPFVLGDMYDNLRYHGLFAKDYDGLDMTAKEYDDHGFGARRYDLDAAVDRNAVPGDFTGRLNAA